MLITCWLFRRISIHAPHTGRDVLIFVLTGLDIDFNPRAPYGARQRLRKCTGSWQKFQSTRPIRGATRCYDPVRQRRHISIHAPHTGRDAAFNVSQGQRRPISIHAPHTGRDIRPSMAIFMPLYFNPRAPYGARHLCRIQVNLRPAFQSTRPIRGATRHGVPAGL